MSTDLEYMWKNLLRQGRGAVSNRLGSKNLPTVLFYLSNHFTHQSGNFFNINEIMTCQNLKTFNDSMYSERDLGVPGWLSWSWVQARRWLSDYKKKISKLKNKKKEKDLISSPSWRFSCSCPGPYSSISCHSPPWAFITQLCTAHATIGNDWFAFTL